MKPTAYFRQTLLGFIRDEAGQSLIEYALVAALIGLAAATAMSGFSTKMKQAFNSVGNSLTSAI